MAEYNLQLLREEYSEVSWYKALGAGLVSGIIKVPEGIVSLGAELVDLEQTPIQLQTLKNFLIK